MIKKEFKNFVNMKTQIISGIIIIGIIIDLFTNSYLFNKNEIFVKYLQSKISKEQSNNFLFFSFFAKERILISIILFIYLFYPIQYSYKIFNVFFFTKSFLNLLKIIFHSQRPFWKYRSFIIKCKSGYGNPSSKSGICFSFFFSLCHIIIINHDNKYVKIISIIITFFILLLFSFYQLLLALNSFDQILFGIFLAIIIYIYFFYHFFEKEEEEEDLNNKNFKYYFDLGLSRTLFFIIYLLFALILQKITYNEREIETIRDIGIEIGCVKQFNQDFSEKSISKVLRIFGIIGSFYGKIFCESVLENLNNYSFLAFLNNIQNKSLLFRINLYIISLFIYFFNIWSLRIKNLYLIINILYPFIIGFLMFGPLTIIRVLIINNENEKVEEKNFLKEIKINNYNPISGDDDSI